MRHDGMVCVGVPRSHCGLAVLLHHPLSPRRDGLPAGQPPAAAPSVGPGAGAASYCRGEKRPAVGSPRVARQWASWMACYASQPVALRCASLAPCPHAGADPVRCLLCHCSSSPRSVRLFLCRVSFSSRHCTCGLCASSAGCIPSLPLSLAVRAVRLPSHPLLRRPPCPAQPPLPPSFNFPLASPLVISIPFILGGCRRPGSLCSTPSVHPLRSRLAWTLCLRRGPRRRPHRRLACVLGICRHPSLGTPADSNQHRQPPPPYRSHRRTRPRCHGISTSSIPRAFVPKGRKPRGLPRPFAHTRHQSRPACPYLAPNQSSPRKGSFGPAIAISPREHDRRRRIPPPSACLSRVAFEGEHLNRPTSSLPSHWLANPNLSIPVSSRPSHHHGQPHPFRPRRRLRKAAGTLREAGHLVERDRHHPGQYCVGCLPFVSPPPPSRFGYT